MLGLWSGLGSAKALFHADGLKQRLFHRGTVQSDSPLAWRRKWPQPPPTLRLPISRSEERMQRQLRQWLCPPNKARSFDKVSNKRWKSAETFGAESCAECVDLGCWSRQFQYPT